MCSQTQSDNTAAAPRRVC